MLPVLASPEIQLEDSTLSLLRIRNEVGEQIDKHRWAHWDTTILKDWRGAPLASFIDGKELVLYVVVRLTCIYKNESLNYLHKVFLSKKLRHL